METGLTLFQLNSERGQAFDGSTRGISILKTVNANAVTGDNGFQIQNGFLELARHAALNARQITVETHGSTAVLHGHVHSLDERRTAEAAAWAAPGITDVDNQLIIQL